MSDYGMQSRMRVCSLSLPTRASSHGLSFLGDRKCSPPLPPQGPIPRGFSRFGEGHLTEGVHSEHPQKLSLFSAHLRLWSTPWWAPSHPS